jgi:hypothetical protein
MLFNIIDKTFQFNSIQFKENAPESTRRPFSPTERPPYSPPAVKVAIGLSLLW